MLYVIKMLTEKICNIADRAMKKHTLAMFLSGIGDLSISEKSTASTVNVKYVPVITPAFSLMHCFITDKQQAKTLYNRPINYNLGVCLSVMHEEELQ